MMAESRRSLWRQMMSNTSSATSGAGCLVFGCTWSRSFLAVSLKDLSVIFCRLEMEMRAARFEKSGCCVAM